MSRIYLKYYIGIILMFLIDSLHIWFFENDDVYDIYIFYDYPEGGRYLTNIFYDISNMFRFSLLTFWLIKLSKTVFTPLFILSIAWWISYFLTYNQDTSMGLIGVYILSVIYYNRNK